MHGADRLRLSAVLYISLPILVFCAGFLRWYYSVLALLALGIAFYLAVGCERDGRQSVSKRAILAVFALSLVWTYFGGLNGCWYQSSDWDCRNAVYFDLIKYDWPVMYDNGGSLVYYIGHWLPPAAISKAIMYLSGSADVALLVGRQLLWIWTSIGVTIVILLLLRVLEVSGRKASCSAVLIFVFFSGMDVLGALLTFRLDLLLSPSMLHLEGWCTGYQFSSMTTLLYWVFNQTVVPWIATLLFMQDRTPRNYVLYGVSCLLCGPFACVGLVVLMVIKAVAFCIREIRAGKGGEALRSVFSLQNVIALLGLFPFVASFLLSANAVSSATATTNVAPTASAGSSSYFNSNLYMFIMIEVGIYLILIIIDHYKNPYYYLLWLMFLVFPYIHVGRSVDFCMRSTIPALFILMTYVNRFLLEHLEFRRRSNDSSLRHTLHRIWSAFLLVFYMVGAVTPVVEIYRGFYHVFDEQTIFLEDLSLITFNRPTGNYNFVTSHPEECFFFTHFSR